MALASQTQHNTISNTALPYVTNTSLVSTSPRFIAGSQNVMTSLRQWSERRPGFSKTVEAAATVFTSLQRLYYWRRWAGSSPNGGAFVAMACDVAGGVAKVYKMVQGVDTNFQLLFTSSSAVPFDFIFANSTVYFGNGTDMKKYDTNALTNWGIVAPAAGPGITLISGSANVYTSWCYCYTYYNSVTLHESSPSPISACSGVFTSKQVQLSVTASTDAQVTNIRIYRTPDGGAQDPALMQEISGSPFPNTTTTHNDSTADASLSIRTAPEFLRNDPPPASSGFVSYAGRFWAFFNNITYYSGNEEIANGVPQECWPSGLAGNNFPWDNEVTAHAPLEDGIAVFNASRIYKIEGNTLDTFRFYTLLEKRGTRNRTAVASVGTSVAWLDTSNTLWLSNLGEIGEPIRPDIQNINPLTAYVAIHISGIFHWVVLLDGANGILYVYDLDTSQWLSPWTVGNSGSALFSGETNVGIIDLMFARNNTKALKIAQGTYQDDSSNYSVGINTNLFPATPANNPAWKGVLDWTELKTDTAIATQVEQLTDDDPVVGTYADLTSTAEDSPDIVQGTSLLTKRYTSGGQLAPECQLTALKLKWAAANSNIHLYQIDIATHPVGA